MKRWRFMETREIFDLSYKRQRLLSIISRASPLQGREFRLTSGRSSNFFIDLKKTMLDREGASLFADLLMRAVDQTRQFQCTILKVIAVVDHLEGAEEKLRQAGISFDALFAQRDFS